MSTLEEASALLANTSNNLQQKAAELARNTYTKEQNAVGSNRVYNGNITSVIDADTSYFTSDDGSIRKVRSADSATSNPNAVEKPKYGADGSLWYDPAQVHRNSTNLNDKQQLLYVAKMNGINPDQVTSEHYQNVANFQDNLWYTLANNGNIDDIYYNPRETYSEYQLPEGGIPVSIQEHRASDVYGRTIASVINKDGVDVSAVARGDNRLTYNANLTPEEANKRHWTTYENIYDSDGKFGETIDLFQAAALRGTSFLSDAYAGHEGAERARKAAGVKLSTQQNIAEKAEGNIFEKATILPEVIADSIGFYSSSIGVGALASAATIASGGSLAAAGGAAVLSRAATSTMNQIESTLIDDFKLNNGGKEPTTAEILNMAAYVFPAEMLDSIGFGLLKSAGVITKAAKIKPTNTLEKLHKDMHAFAKTKKGKALVGAGVFGGGALFEGVQEVVQGIGFEHVTQDMSNKQSLLATASDYYNSGQAKHDFQLGALAGGTMSGAATSAGYVYNKAKGTVSGTTKANLTGNDDLTDVQQQNTSFSSDNGNNLDIIQKIDDDNNLIFNNMSPDELKSYSEQEITENTPAEDKKKIEQAKAISDVANNFIEVTESNEKVIDDPNSSLEAIDKAVANIRRALSIAEKYSVIANTASKINNEVLKKAQNLVQKDIQSGAFSLSAYANNALNNKDTEKKEKSFENFKNLMNNQLGKLNFLVNGFFNNGPQVYDYSDKVFNSETETSNGKFTIHNGGANNKSNDALRNTILPNIAEALRGQLDNLNKLLESNPNDSELQSLRDKVQTSLDAYDNAISNNNIDTTADNNIDTANTVNKNNDNKKTTDKKTDKPQSRKLAKGWRDSNALPQYVLGGNGLNELSPEEKTKLRKELNGIRKDQGDNADINPLIEASNKFFEEKRAEEKAKNDVKTSKSKKDTSKTKNKDASKKEEQKVKSSTKKKGNDKKQVRPEQEGLQLLGSSDEISTNVELIDSGEPEGGVTELGFLDGDNISVGDIPDTDSITKQPVKSTDGKELSVNKQADKYRNRKNSLTKDNIEKLSPNIIATKHIWSNGTVEINKDGSIVLKNVEVQDGSQNILQDITIQNGKINSELIRVLQLAQNHSNPDVKKNIFNFVKIASDKQINELANILADENKADGDIFAYIKQEIHRIDTGEDITLAKDENARKLFNELSKANIDEEAFDSIFEQILNKIGKAKSRMLTHFGKKIGSEKSLDKAYDDEIEGLTTKMSTMSFRLMEKGQGDKYSSVLLKGESVDNIKSKVLNAVRSKNSGSVFRNPFIIRFIFGGTTPSDDKFNSFINQSAFENFALTVDAVASRVLERIISLQDVNSEAFIDTFVRPTNNKKLSIRLIKKVQNEIAQNGIPLDTIINIAGVELYNALGLSFDSTAEISADSRLQNMLGSFIVQYMTKFDADTTGSQFGISISKTAFSSVINNTDNKKSTKESTEATEVEERRIVWLNKGTKDKTIANKNNIMNKNELIDEMFSFDKSKNREITSSPQKATNKYYNKRARLSSKLSSLPSKVINAIKDMNSVKFSIDKSVAEMYLNNKDVMLLRLGFTPKSEIDKITISDLRDIAEAQNLTIVTEFDHFINAIEQAQIDEQNAFFFNFKPSAVLRLNLSSPSVNPQTSKVSRYLLAPTDISGKKNTKSTEATIDNKADDLSIAVAFAQAFDISGTEENITAAFEKINENLSENIKTIEKFLLGTDQSISIEGVDLEVENIGSALGVSQTLKNKQKAIDEGATTYECVAYTGSDASASGITATNLFIGLATDFVDLMRTSGLLKGDNKDPRDFKKNNKEVEIDPYRVVANSIVSDLDTQIEQQKTVSKLNSKETEEDVDKKYIEDSKAVSPLLDWLPNREDIQTSWFREVIKYVIMPMYYTAGKLASTNALFDPLLERMLLEIENIDTSANRDENSYSDREKALMNFLSINKDDIFIIDNKKPITIGKDSKGNVLKNKRDIVNRFRELLKNKSVYTDLKMKKRYINKDGKLGSIPVTFEEALLELLAPQRFEKRTNSLRTIKDRTGYLDVFVDELLNNKDRATGGIDNGMATINNIRGSQADAFVKEEIAKLQKENQKITERDLAQIFVNAINKGIMPSISSHSTSTNKGDLKLTEDTFAGFNQTIKDTFGVELKDLAISLNGKNERVPLTSKNNAQNTIQTQQRTLTTSYLPSATGSGDISTGGTQNLVFESFKEASATMVYMVQSLDSEAMQDLFRSNIKNSIPTLSVLDSAVTNALHALDTNKDFHKSMFKVFTDQSKVINLINDTLYSMVQSDKLTENYTEGQHKELIKTLGEMVTKLIEHNNNLIEYVKDGDAHFNNTKMFKEGGYDVTADDVARLEAQNEKLKVLGNRVTDAQALVDNSVYDSSADGVTDNITKENLEVDLSSEKEVRDLLNKVMDLEKANNTDMTAGFQEYLVDLITNIFTNIGENIKVVIGEAKNNVRVASGQYNSNSNTVTIVPSKTSDVSPRLPFQTAQEVTAHELVHSILSIAISNAKDLGLDNVVNKIYQLQAIAAKHITIEDLAYDNSPESMKRAKELHSYIFQNNKKGIHEFLCYALTNPKVKAKLESVKLRTNQKDMTLFDRIKDIWNRIVALFKGERFADTAPVLNDIFTGNTSIIRKDNVYVALVDLSQNINARANKMSREKTNIEVKAQETAQILHDGINWSNDKAVKGLESLSTSLDGVFGDLFSNVPSKDASAVEKTAFLVKVLPAIAFSSEARTHFVEMVKINSNAYNILKPYNLIGNIVQQITKVNPSEQTKYIERAGLALEQIKGLALDRGNDAFKFISDGFTNLTKQQDYILNKLVLKSDLSSLLDLGLSIEEIQELAINKAKRDAKIVELQNSIDTMVNDKATSNILRTRMNGLLLFMTEEIAPLNVLYNAKAIVERSVDNTRIKLNEGDYQTLESNVDSLLSLESLDFMAKHNPNFGKVFSEMEVNGLQRFMSVHQSRKKDIWGLVDNLEVVKGYTAPKYMAGNKEKITDLISKKDELKKLGYVLETELPNAKGYGLYRSIYNENKYREDGAISMAAQYGIGSNLIGGMSRSTKERTKSSMLDDTLFAVRNSIESDLLNNGSLNTIDQLRMVAKKYPFVPAYNKFESNNIKSFKILLDSETKEKFLEQETSGLELLAHETKNTYIQKNGAAHNKKLVQAIIEFNRKNNPFNQSYSINDMRYYVDVSKDSSNPLIREAYNSLPKEIFEAIKNDGSFQVREDLVLSLLGTKDFSINDILDKSDVIHPRIKQVVSFTENMMKDVATMFKTEIVMLTPAVPIGNAISNTLLLTTKTDRSFVDVMKVQTQSLQETKRYFDLALKARNLEAKKEYDKLTVQEQATLNTIIQQMKRSDIHNLVDEGGMFQSIVEDMRSINGDGLIGKLKKKVKGNKIGEFGAEAVNQLYMGSGTPVHRFMYTATQYGDFVARVAEYKFQMRDVKSTDPNYEKKRQQAIHDALDMFINYSIPNSQMENYLNKIGLLMFSKFLFRIQPVIFKTAVKYPVPLAIFLMSQSLVFDEDDIFEYSMIQYSPTSRVYNPVNTFIEAITPAIVDAF